MITLFTLTALVYSLYAYLPFLSIGKYSHYLLGGLCALAGSVLWVTISRSVSKGQIPLYGLYFDSILTLSFLLVPLFTTKADLTACNMIGIGLMVAGVIVSKM